MAGKYFSCKSPQAVYLPSAFTAWVLLSFLLFSVDQVSAYLNKDRCDLDTSKFLPAPFNSPSPLICSAVWDDFILRYSQSKDNVLRVIVSTLYEGGWVGMGFSKNGEMILSSAMVGWIDYDGKATIKQYFLRGFSPNQVFVDQGRLRIIGSPVAVLKQANMYLAFDLNLSAHLAKQPLLFASSFASPSSMYHLQKHYKKATIIFDFSTGTSHISSFPYQLRRNHEALSVFGWGFLTPLGVLFARYCKQWDPVWYYLHVFFQFLGFIVGVAGFTAGVSLYTKSTINVSSHRGLGIFFFVLYILQMLACFVRPQQETSMHKCWIWYHQWFGWLTVLLAASNIIYGMKLGAANSVMTAGYSFVVVIMLIMFTTLEIIVQIRKRRLMPDSPAFQVYRS